MLKIISIVAAALAAHRAARLATPDDDASWRCDPLAHPALRNMSTAQLADLPIRHPVTCGRTN